MAMTHSWKPSFERAMTLSVHTEKCLRLSFSRQRWLMVGCLCFPGR